MTTKLTDTAHSVPLKDGGSTLPRRNSNAYLSEGGPPDPINFLRRMSNDGSSANDMRRSDSADDYFDSADEDEGAAAAEDLHPTAVILPPRPPRRRRHELTESQRKQDPPARERPLPGQPWPYRDTLSFTRTLIFYGAGSITHESERACRQIQEARSFRQKYYASEGCICAADDILKQANMQFGFGKEGIIEVYAESDINKVNNLVQIPNVDEFNKDYHRLVDIANDGSMRSYCFQRLQLLSSAFRMHVTMNGPAEAAEQSNLLGTDFYRTFKIDNHIHAAAAPTARQFVNFVSKKEDRDLGKVGGL